MAAGGLGNIQGWRGEFGKGRAAVEGEENRRGGE